MRVLTNDEISVVCWQELLSKSHFTTPFQTADFYKLTNSVPGINSNALAIEEDGSLLALAVIIFQKENGLKGYFSKRAIIYGGLVILYEHALILPYLLKEINHRYKSISIYIETRNFHDYSHFKDIFNAHGWLYQPYLNFHLNCSSRTIAWNQLNKNRKRQINKALKIGVTLKEAESLKEVKVFYGILKELYIKKIKKPLLPAEFFEKFYANRVGKYFLVYLKDKVIGGIMCPILPGRAIYEFYICGLDQEYKDASPSVMATYAAIEYGFKNGLQYFDFMGAGKPTEKYGVREFKEKFGGRLVEHGRFIKINNHFLYQLGRISLFIIKKLGK